MTVLRIRLFSKELLNKLVGLFRHTHKHMRAIDGFDHLSVDGVFNVKQPLVKAHAGGFFDQERAVSCDHSNITQRPGTDDTDFSSSEALTAPQSAKLRTLRLTQGFRHSACLQLQPHDSGGAA